jgi:signal transduction histidine kinase
MKIITNLLTKSFLLFTFFFLTSVNSQQLSKEQIKVAYIYNFLKHINWPEENNKSHFVLGIYQDESFSNNLQSSLKNKTVKNKRITTLLVNDISPKNVIDLLYIPAKFNDNLAQIASKVRGSQTLLVTDNSPDKHNTMLNIVDIDDTNAISFEVNKSNIIYEKLTTSAQLLLLGGTELDIASLYRETEQAMQETREHEAALNLQLANQQSKLDLTNSALSKLNQDLQRSATEIEKQQLVVKSLINREQSKERELATILQQLNEANNNYAIQTQAINARKKEVAIKEKENFQMADLIKQNKMILQQQKQNITAQKLELEKQDGKLAAQTETIINQRTTIIIATIVVLIVAIVLILVISLFIKNRKTTQKLSETLTHLEEAQSQLVQSEKMASLGKLIAGVAHEINTPLGIAVTSTSLIQENTEEMAIKLNEKSLSQKQLQSYINIVTESSAISNKGLERVIELMHNFKEVAADQIIESVREINLSKYVNEVMTTLANEMKKNQVHYTFTGDNIVRISTVPGALAQVITNLVNNSIRHGFQPDDDGHNQTSDKRVIINIEQNDIDEVCLTYLDNGIGMNEEVLAQVFDPFFTTKRNKGGTGLGMNIVFNIIEQKLSGHINITSKLGEGVVCKITLPLFLSAD